MITILLLGLFDRIFEVIIPHPAIATNGYGAYDTKLKTCVRPTKRTDYYILS